LEDEMQTVKQLMESEVSISCDGKHYEPALQHSHGAWNWKDAFAVLRGKAIAIRQTEKEDLHKTVKIGG
jgi:hypothetical protein